MIHPERAASGEANTVARSTGHCQQPPPPQGTGGTRTHQVPIWEDLYHAIPPEHQRQLLSLAERQGVLYAYQLPVTANGTAADSRHKPFARLLDGAVAELEPLFADPVQVSDQQLDATQREAVAKALATPDVFLLQGRPGSGKSRVAAEIISGAAARGQRVLLLAPTAAAVDRVLEMVAGRDVVFPVRCVGPEENLSALPPTIRALTLTERARALHLQALEGARQLAEQDEQHARRLQQDEPSWSRLEELARQWEQLERDSHVLEHQRSRLAMEVAEQADTGSPIANDDFTARMRDLTRSHNDVRAQTEKHLADLRGQSDASRQEQAALDTELQALQPLLDAKHHGQWWTGRWWHATFRGNSITTRWTQLQQRREQVRGEVDAVQQQIADEERQWQETKNAFTGRRTDLIAAEVARRQADLQDAEAVVRREQNILQQKWQEVCQGLAPESPRAGAMTVQAVQAARAESCRRLEQAKTRSAFTRQWIAHLEQTPHALIRRLPRYVNLVAATLKTIARDNYFGDLAAGTASLPDFDLLVLEEADQVAEPEFLQAAGRVRRCVLIGAADWSEQTAAAIPAGHAITREPRRSSSGARVHGAPPPRSNVFRHLWQLLHSDPRRLPYAWSREGNRLCCRLRQLAKEERQCVATEHVADFPEIELRILAVPGSRPVLAEIVFPPSFSIDRAKQYIFQELEELAVQASGSSLHWSADADRVVARFAERDLAHSLTIDLASGVREILTTVVADTNDGRPAIGSQTCCLEFDRAAGWDRPRATRWIEQHIGLRDLGRTICLDASYRMEKGLSAFISDFLFASATNGEAAFTIQQVERNGWSGSVQFVPVTAAGESTRASTRGNDGQRRTGAARPGSHAAVVSRKGGAGLELDLSDPRHRARLPAELSNHLPMQGFVNYAEAQALVAALAELVNEGVDKLSSDHEELRKQPAVAVLALYPAQAELIRLLMRREPNLAALGHTVDVDVPYAFRQREAVVVLLSLTRSHTHRAVAFGEGPQMLALAMTRARSRLVIFGDPGTLLRRSQWEGSLEHLDEEAAARERHLITRLIRALPGCGADHQAAYSHT
jgi:uncharacterized coiled-coil DUF342 family protein